MRHRERERWIQLLIDEREAHRRERQELLNRIAAPNIVVQDRPETAPVEQSHDLEELAQVGGIASDNFRPPSEEDG